MANRNNDPDSNGGVAAASVNAVRIRWQSLILAACLPLTLHFILYYHKVPLGCPGRLVYPYTSLFMQRMSTVIPALVLALIASAGVWAIADPRRAMQRLAVTLLFVAALGITIWNYIAPPAYIQQHVFNTQTPAQDGAFLRESLIVSDVSLYLRSFPLRATSPPEVMRGTRVISNPPATTLLAVFAGRILDWWPWLRLQLEATIEAPEPEFTEFRLTAARGLLFLTLLNVIWMLAILPLFAIGQEFFSRPVAAAFAFVVCASPMTFTFAPGKDPAQLLSTAIPLWLLLRAYRRDATAPAAFAGLLFALSCSVGLVHIWVFACVFLAMTFASISDIRRLGRSGRLAVWFLAGIIIGAICLRGSGLDLFDTLQSVAVAQSKVTRGPDAMPFYWQLLGIPLFALFAGVSLWWSVISRFTGAAAGSPAVDGKPPPSEPPSRRTPLSPDCAFGGWLVACTLAILAATSIFTNIETPRLWIPFLPLLVLGGWLRISPFGETFSSPPFTSMRRLAAGVVLIHISAAAVQWALMDMRETELRLMTNLFYGAG